MPMQLKLQVHNRKKRILKSLGLHPALFHNFAIDRSHEIEVIPQGLLQLQQCFCPCYILQKPPDFYLLITGIIFNLGIQARNFKIILNSFFIPHIKSLSKSVKSTFEMVLESIPTVLTKAALLHFPTILNLEKCD